MAQWFMYCTREWYKMAKRGLADVVNAKEVSELSMLALSTEAERCPVENRGRCMKQFSKIHII